MEKNKFILSIIAIIGAVIVTSIYILKLKDVELKDKDLEIEKTKVELERVKNDGKEKDVQLQEKNIQLQEKKNKSLTVTSSKSESDTKNAYVMCIQAASVRAGVTTRDINELCSEMNLKKGYYHSSNK
jgi:uncharacterized protein YxeA